MPPADPPSSRGPKPRKGLKLSPPKAPRPPVASRRKVPGSGAKKGQKYGKWRHLTINETAKLLVDATILGDKGAEAKHACSHSALSHAKRRVEREPALKQRVLYYQAKLDNSWASDVPKAIKKVIAFIARATEVADPGDPEAIKSLVEAAKSLAGIEAAKYILNERIKERRRTSWESWHGVQNPLLAPAATSANSVIIEAEAAVDEPEPGTRNRETSPSSGSSTRGGESESVSVSVAEGGAAEDEPVIAPVGPSPDDFGTGGRHRQYWEHR